MLYIVLNMAQVKHYNVLFKNVLLDTLLLILDISTPAIVLDRLSEVLQTHMNHDTAQLKTDSGVVSFTAGDLLKVQLLVCFKHSRDGESSSQSQIKT